MTARRSSPARSFRYGPGTTVGQVECLGKDLLLCRVEKEAAYTGAAMTPECGANLSTLYFRPSQSLPVLPHYTSLVYKPIRSSLGRAEKFGTSCREIQIEQRICYSGHAMSIAWIHLFAQLPVSLRNLPEQASLLALLSLFH